MAKSGIEVVFEGWLTKSPPPKWILRPKWRRRWFTLTYSGEIPGQFVLTYYTDRNCRELKGSIDLDHCEQVDLGLKLEEGEHKFEYVFDIKTPTRTYYLAADSEDEMRSWVDCICKVCGLKSTSEDEDLHPTPNGAIFDQEMAVLGSADTPPISPVSTSPYIPISECITGKSPILDQQDFKTLLQYNMKNSFFKLELSKLPQQPQNYINYVNDVQDPRFYDSPRQLAPQKSDNKNEKNSPLHSPTDSESVFTDEDWVHNTSDLNSSKNTRPSDSSDVAPKCTKTENEKKSAPPRPPKTNLNQSANYLNLTALGLSEDKNGSQKQLISDEMYDFPRSHHQLDSDQVRNVLMRRHCYNNAAPVKIEGQIFRYDISPKPGTSNTQFRYDLDDVQSQQDEPASPVSQSSSTIAYSNLPSPLLGNTTDGQLMPPPIVNRDLKPKRKLSDSVSVASNPEPSSPRFGAPSVDRKLKPVTPLQEAHMRKNFSLDETRKSGKKSRKPDDFKFIDDNRNFTRIRTTRSPSLGRSHESLLSQNEPSEQIYHYLPGKMQYLDLDLECGSGSFANNVGTNSLLPKSPDSNNTVYKKVDFMKTQAFNITRNNLEKERKEPVTFLKK